MTDWLPWGFVVMAGTFTTLALTLRAIVRAPAGSKPDLSAAWWALAASAIAAFGVYLLYILYGESWVWYLR